jgi:phosphatidate cytidylyltransferase
MVVGGYLRGEAALLFGVALAMALSVLWYMAAPVKARKGTVPNVAATLLGVLYVPFMASYALILLRAPEIPGQSSGRNLLLLVIGLTVLYDVSAYGIGTWWGSRPLAPTISPKKSWEGVVGATFMLLLAALTLVPLFTPFKEDGGPGAGGAVGLVLVIAIAAPLGDLVESALKRDFGIKDMGSLLPGHGGVLDRIDSLLFTLPMAWYFLRIVLL